MTVIVPLYLESLPRRLSKRAIKEEVQDILFSSQIAHDTRVPIIQMEMSSSQHVSCVESVH